MSTAMSIPGNTADTFLSHYFGGGLDGDDRFVVERFKALSSGDIRPIPDNAADAKGPTEVRAHRGLAQVGRGDASRPHRDHHLHRPPLTRRTTGMGESGSRDFR